MEDRKGGNAGDRGVGFKDEFHSRLKYNRRGLLGMANEGVDSNGSQFFITLGNTPELQGKNTLFGRVEGETIYNVARMGEMEVGEGERPVYPVRVTGVEILVDPFGDMVKRVRVAEAVREKLPEKKKKRKVGKQLLSFEGEDGEDEQPVLKKAKFDTRVVVDNEDAEPAPKPKVAKEVKERIAKPVSVESSPDPTPVPVKAIPNRAAKVASRSPSSSPEPVQKVSSLLDRTNAQIAELKASMKRNVQTAPVPEKKKSALEAMIPSTSVRARKRGAHNHTSASDQKALDILKAFRSKLEQAPPEKETKTPSGPSDHSNQNGEAKEDDEEAVLCDLHFLANCQSCSKWDAQDEKAEEDEDDGIGWMSHALSFKEDKLGKDLSYRKKAEDELVVIDPREKARTLKEEMRAQREAKAGGSGRAWDQARNEKLARGSALAGRGAR